MRKRVPNLSLFGIFKKKKTSVCFQGIVLLQKEVSWKLVDVGKLGAYSGAGSDTIRHGGLCDGHSGWRKTARG